MKKKFTQGGEGGQKNGTLCDRFLVPPFSTLDTKQGYWQKRMKAWKDAGLDSRTGRKENLLSGMRTGGLKQLAQQHGMTLTGTSTFDPVLCEVMYNWYCPDHGIVLDPFAGGSVRGVIAEILGRHYIGIDLSRQQIEANRVNAKAFGVNPAWHCDDSRNVDEYIQDGKADFLFSCPPYFDLEKYSDDPRDLSNMDYEAFCDTYESIIAKCCGKLKNDRFAVFVVSDIRDKRGAYRCLPDLTRRIFLEQGLMLYNDNVLLNQYATAALRAANGFKLRKMTRTHQNVLVFYKGDIEAIRQNYPMEFRWADLDGIKNRIDSTQIYPYMY